MIASVRGVVDAVTAQDTVINVGGVGLRMMATPTTLSTLTLGRESTLVTSLIVREDSMTLYGFADDDEREVFDILITLSGIGPRLGLAVLSVLTPDAICRAVSSKVLAPHVAPLIHPLPQRAVPRSLMHLWDSAGTSAMPPLRSKRLPPNTARSQWLTCFAAHFKL